MLMTIKQAGEATGKSKATILRVRDGGGSIMFSLVVQRGRNWNIRYRSPNRH